MTFGLLDQEKIIWGQRGNWMASVTDHNMKPMPGEWLRRATGAVEGAESVGGHLSLTNFRLVFVSHPLNRLRGQVSIFLPTVESVADTSKGLYRQVTIRTMAGDTVFVVGKREELMRAMRIAQESMTPEMVTGIAPQLVARPELLGDRTTYSKLVNALYLSSSSSGDLFQLATDPASLETVASLVGLAGTAAQITDDHLQDRGTPEKRDD